MASIINAPADGITQGHSFRLNPLRQINAGGIGQPPGVTDLSRDNSWERIRYEKQYLPGQSRSLSGIALRAFLLGNGLSFYLLATFYLLSKSSHFWRLPAFLAALSLFHFLEFWTTARYNTPTAQISSFLLSQNGNAYNIAHTSAMLECFIVNYFFENRQWVSLPVRYSIIALGCGMVVVGQLVRSVAMVQAGTNFNHVVQHQKRVEHQLVTTGLYGCLRHPSYFGFFWWGLGTQLILGNAICFIGYAVVLWRFFARRIEGKFCRYPLHSG